MLTNIRNKKAFTIIELIVVIAIIGILVLFGLPRLLGYVEKAHLARIQHDVKVMETIMEDEIIQNERRNFNNFDQNGKRLGALILANKLYEKEGYAQNIEYVEPDKDFILGNEDYSEKKTLLTFNEKLERENDVLELGMGGPGIVKEINHEDIEDPSFSYKVIPTDYKGEAKTRLKGTFYVNENGKVYYEPDKPIKRNAPAPVCNAPVPEPDYDFDHLTGKIIKYHGNAEHLIIPPYFMVDGECWPVRIIGKGAFMQGNFRSIVIPETVWIIEDFAFEDGVLEKIYIPGSVREIGNGAFNGNNLKEIIYGGRSQDVTYSGGGGGIYIQRGGGSVSITYRTPTPGQSGIIYIPTTGGGGTIVKGGGSYIPPYVNVGGQDRPVTAIAEGAYQGLGLITVQLPHTLEIIEDYAFAGNQLIAVEIPQSVKHIGNYAFAFNELFKTGEIAGPETKVTIKSIILKNDEYRDKTNLYGDILEDDLKLDILPGTESTGPDMVLKNHIWVNSEGNVVIDKKYIEGEIPQHINPQHIKYLRLLEKVSSAYHNKYNKYPTTSDMSYTVHEVKGFSDNLLDRDGNEVEFNYGQSYFDFNYDVMKTIDVPANQRINYLIDDKGNAYYLQGINNKGLARQPQESGREAEDGEITIRTAQDLNNMRNNLDGNYVLMNNIDLSEYTNWAPIMNFNGTFDGNNYTIKNLNINRTADYTGLFGTNTANSVIKNVVLDNVDIKGGIATGGLIGFNGGSIENVHTSGKIHSQKYSDNSRRNSEIGGIAGINHGKIINSSSNSNISAVGVVAGGISGTHRGTIDFCYFNGTLSAERRSNSIAYIGGIVGYTFHSAQITNSYVLVDQTLGGTASGNAIGGITGTLGGYEYSTPAHIRNSYFIGNLPSGRTGGITGYGAGGTSTIINSYFNSNTTTINGYQISGSLSTENSGSKSLEELKQQSTFNDWDFDNIWALDDSYPYPYLRNNPPRY